MKISDFHGSFAPEIASLRLSRLFVHSLLIKPVRESKVGKCFFFGVWRVSEWLAATLEMFAELAPANTISLWKS